MSTRNDEAFATFMVKLAKRLFETEKAEQAEMARRKAEHEAMMQLASSGGYTNTSTPTPAAVAQGMNGLLGILSQITRSQQTSQALRTTNTVNTSAHTHGWNWHSGGQIVDDSDMEIIRAYFEGEDVIATLLAQER